MIPHLLYFISLARIFHGLTNTTDYSFNPSLSNAQASQGGIVSEEECDESFGDGSTKSVLHKILDDGYDKTIVPSKNGALVSVEVALQTFSDISESSASFTADILLR